MIIDAMAKRRVTDKEIENAYEKKGANISATCKSLNIDRQTFYNRRKKSKSLDEALSQVEESLIDFAESKLMSAIQDDNLTAIIFYLKTKGKKRGYIEGREIDANIGGDVDIKPLTAEEIEILKKGVK